MAEIRANRGDGEKGADGRGENRRGVQQEATCVTSCRGSWRGRWKLKHAGGVLHLSPCPRWCQWPVDECVCAGWVLGVGVGEWVNGWGISQRCRNAQVSHRCSRTLHISRVSSQCSRGTWAWGAPCASLLVRQIILMSHCVEQGVWIRRGETC